MATTHNQTTTIHRFTSRRRSSLSMKTNISSIQSIFIIVIPIFTTIWLLILHHSFLEIQQSSRSLVENTDDPQSPQLSRNNQKVTIINKKNRTTQTINDKYTIHYNHFNDIHDIDNLKLPQWMKGKIVDNVYVVL